jgi:hypothetical protein
MRKLKEIAGFMDPVTLKYIVAAVFVVVVSVLGLRHDTDRSLFACYPSLDQDLRPVWNWCRDDPESSMSNDSLNGETPNEAQPEVKKQPAL